MSSAQIKSRNRKTAPRRRAPPHRAEGVHPQGRQISKKESDLALEWFRLLARCRGAWLQHLWMSDESIDGRATVTHAELASVLANQDAPAAEAEWASSEEPVRAWQVEAEQIHDALRTYENSRFRRLGRVFGLSDEELDLLRLCAALVFEPALSRVAAYLQDHSGRTYLTEDLASRLLRMPPAWFPEMNVFRWELIQRREMGVGEPHALLCDQQVKHWLMGKSTLNEYLIGAAKLIDSDGAELPEWPVGEISLWVQHALSVENPPRLRILVVAPRGGGKRTFAAAVARRLRMPLLVVNADSTEDSIWPRLFMHAQRQVFLDTAALAWVGESVVRRLWPAEQFMFPLQFLLCEPGVEPPVMPGIVQREIRLRMPGPATRATLWKNSSSVALKWNPDERKKLAEQHSIWPGDIARAFQLGADTPKKAAAVVRESARSRFGNLAQILECPFTPDDLVVPPGVKHILDAITFEARERVTFWQGDVPRRLFPQGRGLTVLFSGPSGTGKTMAAQVIAAQLTQDLCRVNVAQLVSKWVGETPKNVESVIRVAAENDAVLFFDEADAVFGRRSPEIRDAQDKFANTDTAFLLQAIESYPGIAILATNLKSNIDPAFLRRIRFVLEFPKPDAKLQRQLWQKVVAAMDGENRAADLAPAIDILSTSGEATGAQIKFAVLGALFAARSEKRPLSARHLLLGFDRELGKEGRAIGPKERERILRLKETS